MISFNNNIFCTNTIPADNNIDPTHDLQTMKYQFIYTPVGSITPISPSAEGVSEGSQQARDNGDIANSGGGSNDKDGV